MQEYKRENPLFSLCGLNCGLCPRYHTEGVSKCPGCGGKDFHLKHPACAVITCNTKHDKVEYCFQCSEYPCKKYVAVSDSDSFITYRNVLADFTKAREYGLESYFRDLQAKINFLEYLLANFNDGRRKNFYCLAVNLFTIEEIETKLTTRYVDKESQIKVILPIFEEQAKEKGVILKLRKKEKQE